MKTQHSQKYKINFNKFKKRVHTHTKNKNKKEFTKLTLKKKKKISSPGENMVIPSEIEEFLGIILFHLQLKHKILNKSEYYALFFFSYR